MTHPITFRMNLSTSYWTIFLPVWRLPSPNSPSVWWRETPNSSTLSWVCHKTFLGPESNVSRVSWASFFLTNIFNYMLYNLFLNPIIPPYFNHSNTFVHTFHTKPFKMSIWQVIFLEQNLQCKWQLSSYQGKNKELMQGGAHFDKTSRCIYPFLIFLCSNY